MANTIISVKGEFLNVESSIRASYPIAAIIGIAYIEKCAIEAGIDGTALVLSLTAIAGIGGYYFAKKKSQTN